MGNYITAKKVYILQIIQIRIYIAILVFHECRAVSKDKQVKYLKLTKEVTTVESKFL